MSRRLRLLILFLPLLVAAGFVPAGAQSAGPVYSDPKPDVFMKRWLLLGPISLTDSKTVDEEALKGAFPRDLLEGSGGEAKAQPAPGQTVRWQGQEYVWKETESDGDTIDFLKLSGPKQNFVVYAWAEIEVPAARKAELGIGSDDAVKVWLNGEVIHEIRVFRGVTPDEDLTSASFRPGRNQLLIKVMNGAGPAGFTCRLVSPKTASRSLFAAASGGRGPNPGAVPRLLDRLERDLAAGPETLARNWALEESERHSFGRMDVPLSPALRYRLGSVAERCSAAMDALPDGGRGGLAFLAARFYEGAGQPKKAMAALRAVVRAPGDHPTAAFRRENLRFLTGSKRGDPPVDACVKAEMARNHIPGVSVAVVRDGKVVMARGYGLANVELSVPATPETVYEIGSITKQFTATALMMLVGEGKLRLEDRVRQHLPDLPAAWDGVTLRHLLDHTSGIKSYTGVAELWKNMRQDLPKEEVLKLIRDVPMDFQPGERYSYNNSGYFLAGMVIEKITGKSFAQVLQERIFKPLGMTATRLYDFRELMKNRATGYTWEKETLRNFEPWSPTQTYAAGAMASTVLDMAKWDAALYTERLLPHASLEQMWTPSKLGDGKPIDYGLGWAVTRDDGRRVALHGGGLSGFVTTITRFIDDRLTVIVLTNSDTGDPGGIAFQVARYYLPEPSASQAEASAATTERLRQALAGLAEGRAEASLFTPEARAMLLPALKDTSAFYRSLGPLRSVQLIEQRTEGKNQVYRYRTLFKGATWMHRCVLTGEGTIAEWTVAPV